MIEVTDMILDLEELPVAQHPRDVGLRPMSPETRSAILSLVETENRAFYKYYDSPKPRTTIYSVVSDNQMVGAVLLEELPDAAETEKDGSLACLVVSSRFRGQGFGSAAITACCEELAKRGFDRVIAEWVASVDLYERLGFHVWKTRTIEVDGN